MSQKQAQTMLHSNFGIDFATLTLLGTLYAKNGAGNRAPDISSSRTLQSQQGPSGNEARRAETLISSSGWWGASRGPHSQHLS